MRQALDIGKGVIKVLEIGKLGAQPITFSTLRACPSCGTGFPEPDPRLFSYNAKHGWCPKCYGTGLKTAAPHRGPGRARPRRRGGGHRRRRALPGLRGRA